MTELKSICKHEWEYFDEHDFPNGYEYEQVNIPHKRCKKCGREYELFDGYGEYVKRWRKIEPWLPDLHKIEEKLARTKKQLEIALDALKEIKDGKIPVSLGIYMDINEALEQITALEQKDVK